MGWFDSSWVRVSGASDDRPTTGPTRWRSDGDATRASASVDDLARGLRIYMAACVLLWALAAVAGWARVLRSAHPIPVVDGDERIGVVDAGQLLPALIGHRPPVPA